MGLSATSLTALHLAECVTIELIVHMVDDEMFCHKFKPIGAGVLRCRGGDRWVHHKQICDGVVDCPGFPNDEIYCNRNCPTHWTCTGRAAACDGQSAPLVWKDHNKFSNIEILVCSSTPLAETFFNVWNNHIFLS